MGLREAIANKLRCWSFNRFACYRGTGARLGYVAPDWSEIRIELPLSRRTRNYVGTIFGGSLYGAVDPIYMIMRSEEHTSELQSPCNLVCRLLLEKKKKRKSRMSAHSAHIQRTTALY